MDLAIDIYADTAYLTEIAAWRNEPHIRGFTVNPTLLRQAGVTRYSAWIAAAIAFVPSLPLSLPMLAPDLAHMEIQARALAAWGPNVYVKIPIQTSAGESTLPLIQKLSHDGIPLNITAVFTIEQVQAIGPAIEGGAAALVSMFAGRIADCGCDPWDHLEYARTLLPQSNARLVWASARGVFDVRQAQDAGCDIITLPPALLLKLPLLGKDLDTYSRETVAQFEEAASGLRW